MARIDPSPKMKKKLLAKNANSCCVCKKTGIGLNFHHIDGDNQNTIESNIAVLCVKDHDHTHRPIEYIAFNHMDLSGSEILKYKQSWEAFVNECKKDNPQVLAMLTVYGTEKNIVGMKLVFQWVNEKVEFVRTYQLLDASPEKWVDYAIDEVMRLGKNVKIALCNAPDEIEYCDDCDNSYLRYLDTCAATKITAIDWDSESLATIYINPNQASLAIIIFYKNEPIYQLSIHKCGNKLNVSDKKRNDSFTYLRGLSKRKQTVQFVNNLLKDWDIKRRFIGTGDYDKPTIINELKLPKCWESSN